MRCQLKSPPPAGPGLSGAEKLSGDWEVSSGLPLPGPEAKLGKLWLLTAVLPGVVSPWPAAREHLALHSPALVSAALAGSGNSAQEQGRHSSGLGFAQ